MTPNVVAIWSEASVVEAAKLMLERGISGLPAVNDERRLTGIVTEGDLLRRVEIGTEPRHSGQSSPSKSSCVLLCEYLKSRGQRVENIMSPDGLCQVYVLGTRNGCVLGRDRPAFGT